MFSGVQKWNIGWKWVTQVFTYKVGTFTVNFEYIFDLMNKKTVLSCN